MKALTQKKLLKEHIVALENKQVHDFETLKNQYQVTIDSFKPLNLIKDSILDVATVSNIKSYLINGAVGLGAYYLSKTFTNENEKNAMKRTIGKVVNFALKNFFGKK